MAESKQPFKVMKDKGFLILMKTGHPEYCLPSPVTVARDVKHVFVNIRPQLSRMLMAIDLPVLLHKADPCCRTTMVLSTLPQIPGPPPMAKHSLL
jgi:hypothetical protein